MSTTDRTDGATGAAEHQDARLAASAPDAIVQVDKNMLSRLLYPNPVCLLSVQSGDDDASRRRNVMTITWLTPINNHVRR